MKRAGKHDLKILRPLAWKQEQIRSQGSSSKKEGEIPQVGGSALFFMQATAKSPGSEAFSDHLAHPSMLTYLCTDTKTHVGRNPEF